jgi:flagellar biogenesis protein FliO
MPWSFWASYFERLGAVAVVLATLYGAVRMFARPWIVLRRSRSLRLIESLAVSQHAALHLVQAGNRYFLIGTTVSGVAELAELASGDAEAKR